MGLGGFEPPTRSLGNCCSIHLSYSPHTSIVIRPGREGLAANSGARKTRGLVFMKNTFAQSVSDDRAFRAEREEKAAASRRTPSSGHGWPLALL